MSVILSELTRLNRRSFFLGWLGLSALLPAIIVAFVFTAAGEGTEVPAGGPGASFPSLVRLTQPDGFIAGMSGAATILGVVTLSFWAIAAATDFSTGLIRLLIQAEPRRYRLLTGKVVALILWTAAATTVATSVVLLTSLAMGHPSGVDTSSWGDEGMRTTVTDIVGVWMNTLLSLIIWGVVGLMIAVVARSSALAIAVGVGYVLVVESIVGLVAGDAANWLPGSVLTALSSGGSAQVSYAAALSVGFIYILLALGTSMVVFTRRDITD